MPGERIPEPTGIKRRGEEEKIEDDSGDFTLRRPAFSDWPSWESINTEARTRRWRIPEKTLFLTAALGGSPGVWVGMYLFRHKTKHVSFVLGIPLILIVQTALLIFMRLR